MTDSAGFRYGRETTVGTPCIDPATGRRHVSNPGLVNADVTIKYNWSGSYGPVTNTVTFSEGDMIITLTASEMSNGGGLCEVIAVRFEDASSPSSPAFQDSLVVARLGGDPNAYYDRT